MSTLATDRDTLSLAERLAADPGLRSAARRRLTRDNPQRFAEIYLSHHLKGPETGNQITYSQFHLDLFEVAREWRIPPDGPGECRDCYVAPRNAGKSTLCFLVFPLWLAAHGHIDFIAAFAHSGAQAELHLQTFKTELETNELLREDYPDLVAPARRARGATMADRQNMWISRSGFVFAAKGIDAATLGMKVGNRRPGLLLLDDVEPDESNYSAYQKAKRLRTMVDAVFALSLYARVVIVGTVTMHGSIIHDLVRTKTDHDPPEWPAEERITTHYYPALITADDGTEASLWPEMWSLDYLHSIRHTRTFAKNFQNHPMAPDGAFWTDADFRYDVPDAITKRILSIDPANTSKTSSDYTGLAVVGYDPTVQRCAVHRTEQVKLQPAQLRQHVLRILANDPGIRMVLIEVDNGGDTWREIMQPLPVKVVAITQSMSKQVRASQVLDWYQFGWVAHDGPQRAFEQQAKAFPNVVNDDVVDAVVSGIRFWLKDKKRGPRPKPVTRSYV